MGCDENNLIFLVNIDSSEILMKFSVFVLFFSHISRSRIVYLLEVCINGTYLYVYFWIAKQFHSVVFSLIERFEGVNIFSSVECRVI